MWFLETVPTTDLTPFASLGIGGLLAGVMFYFYRQDRQSSESRLAKVLDDFKDIITANTQAMVSLKESIEKKEK